MSLKFFHIVFIVLSTITALGFGAWGYKTYRLNHEAGYLVLSLVSFLAGLVLIFYGKWFVGKLRKLCLVFSLLTAPIVFPNDLFACSVCYADPSSQMAKGVSMGVLFLLAMVVPLLIGFAAFFTYLGRRSRMYAGGGRLNHL